jgi:hypothetical protein
MCACKETDVRESPNDSTPAGGEGQGSRGETFHPIYGESPVFSVAEHHLEYMLPVIYFNRVQYSKSSIFCDISSCSQAKII